MGKIIGLIIKEPKVKVEEKIKKEVVKEEKKK